MTEALDQQVHDVNAELGVLACCLWSSVARDEAKRHLVGGDFFNPHHETVWDAIFALERAGEAIDHSTVFTAVGPELGKSIVVPMVNYPTIPEAVASHARKVRGWAVRRRLHAEAIRTQQTALNPSLDEQVLTAEAANRFTQLRDSGITGDASSITLGELLESTDDEPDWIIPHLLERRDRLMLTGEEGLGKSYLLRQIAVMAAAGLDPFDEAKRIRPVRVTIVDAENSQRQIRRKVRPVVGFANHHGHGDARQVNLLCTPRMDITRDKDLARLHFELDAAQPEILIIGPLYRLTPRALQTDDEAAPVLAALDTLRERGCALLIEAHAGHAIGKGGTRDLRPRGSSALLGWPEFGYGMRNIGGGYADLVPWRGDRDNRDWPDRVRQSRDGIRWIPVDGSLDPGDWS